MTPQAQVCPDCGAEGKSNRVSIHSRKDKRYRCKDCGRTFTETLGTALYQLKKPELFVTVMTLIAFGCPPRAIEMAYGLSNNTVRDWMRRSGHHCEAVHEQTVGAHEWDLQHIQADEIKVSPQGKDMWMALIMMVSTRLWLGGSVDVKRSIELIHSCFQQAARCALCRPLLVAVDGMHMYGNAIKKTFRRQHPIGKGGRMKWVNWTEIVMTQVIKRRKINGKQKRGDIQRVVKRGTLEEAQRLQHLSGGGTVINTAYIERLNATFRQRIAGLARRSRAQVRQVETLRASMFLTGCVYNFCCEHRSLSEAIYLSPRRKHWVRRTSAMAAQLTDHRWTIYELFTYKIQGRVA